MSELTRKRPQSDGRLWIKHSYSIVELFLAY